MDSLFLSFNLHFSIIRSDVEKLLRKKCFLKQFKERAKCLGAHETQKKHSKNIHNVVHQDNDDESWRDDNKYRASGIYGFSLFRSLCKSDDLKNGLILETRERASERDIDKQKACGARRENDYCIKSLKDQRQIIDDNVDVTIGTSNIQNEGEVRGMRKTCGIQGQFLGVSKLKQNLQIASVKV